MARDNENQLLSIRGISELIPLGMAIRWGHMDMANYLFDEMDGEAYPCNLSPSNPDLMKLFIMSISNNLYGMYERIDQSPCTLIQFIMIMMIW